MTKPDGKEHRGVTDFPQNERNPFLGRMHIRGRPKHVHMQGGKQLSLMDHQTGELLDEMAVIGIRKRVDDAAFVKVYKAQMRAFFDLSARAMKVLGYFMEATRINEDTVYFTLARCMEHTGYGSRNTVLLGLAELLDRGFIARTKEQNLYFIDPEKFFNGDRFVVINDYVRKGTAIDRALQERDRREAEERSRLEGEPPLPLIGGGMADGSKEESHAP